MLSLHWFVFSLRLEERVRSEEIYSNVALAKSQCTTGLPWPRSRSRYVQLPGWLGERGGLILFHIVQWNLPWHGMAWLEKLRSFVFFTSPQNFENNILTGGSFWVPVLPHRRDWGCQEVPILNFTIAGSILFSNLRCSRNAMIDINFIVNSIFF